MLFCDASKIHACIIFICYLLLIFNLLNDEFQLLIFELIPMLILIFESQNFCNNLLLIFQLYSNYF